ncbi:TIGR02677 family protein [uncultured Pseudokineococcus sp.]|uniref:TIGR02677 family protein n=1 Tax=uncultured Pseudokineococcus sp. TaxID=1642928 RepID=UPI002615AFEB|nr:TIGR02677 family protein [uncultured Pseudokineococcus sp.]
MPERALLYRYVTAESSAEYLAVMRLFTGTLLAELSAGDVAAQLAESGVELDAAVAQQRCEQLLEWGNLVASPNDARVATIRDYTRSRSRYQVSPLGGRVHREVDAVLDAVDGARDVARELLGGTVAALDRLLTALKVGEPDAEALAADVTTVFANQSLFTDSVKDFYAFLATRLSRYDLAGEEYEAFKGLLLDYVELISADVARHSPAVVERLGRVEPHLDRLLGLLADLPSFAAASGGLLAQGRARADWDGLAGWYTGAGGRSGPAQLRGATEQALGQLIANAKRMISSASGGVSRRGDLLRLASWFTECTDEEAHHLFAAAFGAHPARHLLVGPDEPDAHASATTSWWDADPVDVPVSLRERGDRAARGRTPRVPDPGLDRERLLAEAAEDLAQRRAAAAELAAAGDLDGASVSPAARDLLLDRVAGLLAVDPLLTAPLEATDDDLDLVVVVEAAPGEVTVVAAHDGTATVHGLRLRARRASVGSVDEAPDQPTGQERRWGT